MNIYSFKIWRNTLLWFMGVTLATLSSTALVHAVTTSSVAPGVTPSVLYYQADATGNLAAMTDERGRVAWRADVRPFGQGTANPQDYPLRFLDQPLEAESGAEGGLYHLGARTYDPVAGRFLTTDPLPLIGITREEPQRFNRYAYGLNNPYRYMDPTGAQSTPAMPDLSAAARDADLDLWSRLFGAGLEAGAFGFISALCPWCGITIGLVAIENDRDANLLPVAGALAGGRGIADDVVETVAIAPVSRQISPYVGKSASEINKLIGAQQRELLRDFFGRGLKGAQERAANFTVPQGLTRQALEGYEELARRAINSGIDEAGVQAARLELVQRAYEVFP